MTGRRRWLIGIVFALLLVVAGVFLTAGSHELVYGWYVVLGAFLLRQGLSQERATRSLTAAHDRKKIAATA